MPEKYVRLVKDMYEGVRTQVRSSVGLTRWITVRVGMHQGSSLNLYLFDFIMDVLAQGIKNQAPWCMVFAVDVVLCSTSKEEVERKAEN